MSYHSLFALYLELGKKNKMVAGSGFFGDRLEVKAAGTTDLGVTPTTELKRFRSYEPRGIGLASPTRYAWVEDGRAEF